MSDDTIKLEVVTPKGVVLAVDVLEFTAPSVDGEFGVLPGHRPLLAALRTGILSYAAHGENRQAAVGPGFVEFAKGRAVLLTDKFIAKHDVDPVRVRLDLKHVDEELFGYDGEPGSPEQLAMIDKQLWAVAQLELYGDPPPPAVKAYTFTGPRPEQYERILETADAEDTTASKTEDTEQG